MKTGIGYPYDKYAVKFLFKSQCPSAKKEFITNKFLYAAYEIFLRCNNVPAVSVVKPYDFASNDCVVSCGIDNYDCAVGKISVSIELCCSFKISYAGANPRGYFYDPEHIESMIRGQKFHH